MGFGSTTGRLAVGVFLLGTLLTPARGESNRIHVYRQADGSRVFTDQQPARSTMTYLGQYGRAPATASCQGWSAEGLEQRGRYYDVLVDQYAGQFGLEPALVKAVMRVESCFDRKAISRSGARGLMQLMPATARELGVVNSFDPAQNIRGGVQYLSDMLRRFNRDLSLALAAYNAGPGNVERHQGIPPFPQTQSYVQRVMREYQRLSAS